MTLRKLLWSSYLSVVMVMPAVPAAAATVNGCSAGQSPAVSSTSNFKGEANAIFEDIQSDARQLLDHASTLSSFAADPYMSWQTHADQLNYLKTDINDIGDKVCRLETIRGVVAPWQQHVIDQIAMTTRLMADNAEDAIVFGDSHQQDLWLPAYQDRVSTLFKEATSLTHSVGNAVQYAGVSREYRNLRHNL